MRSMKFFMNIQIAEASSCFDPYRCLHAVIGPVLAPALGDIEVLQRIRAVHFHKGNASRNLHALFDFLNNNARQRLSKGIHLKARDLIRHEGSRPAAPCFLQTVYQMASAVILDHHLTGVGKLRQVFRHQKRRHPIFRLGMINILGEHLSLKQCRIFNKQDIVRLRNRVLTLTCTVFILLSASKDIPEVEKDIPDLDLIARHEPYTLVLGPDMRKPAHAFPVLQVSPVFLIVYIDKFYVRITVAGCDRSSQNVHHIITAASSASADQSDQLVFPDIDTDRNLPQRLVLIQDLLRLICERVAHKRELFSGYFYGDLEVSIPDTKSLIEKILMRCIAVPQFRTARSKSKTLPDRRVHRTQSPGIVEIHLLYLFCDL